MYLNKMTHHSEILYQSNLLECLQRIKQFLVQFAIENFFVELSFIF